LNRQQYTDGFTDIDQTIVTDPIFIGDQQDVKVPMNITLAKNDNNDVYLGAPDPLAPVIMKDVMFIHPSVHLYYQGGQVIGNGPGYIEFKVVQDQIIPGMNNGQVSNGVTVVDNPYTLFFIAKFYDSDKILLANYMVPYIQIYAGAQYVDTDNNKIAPDEFTAGQIGDSYTTSAKKIAGYTLKKVLGDPTGQMQKTPQIVTYVYAKEPIKAQDVTVHYQDTAGNKIADDTVISGFVDDLFTTSAKKITDYTFKEVKGKATGKLTTSAQSVIYIYTKNPEPKPTPKPTPHHLSKVVAHYQDENGKELSPSITQSGTLGNSYTTSQKEISGYTFKKVTGKTAGKFQENDQDIVYIYTPVSKNHRSPSII
jgi:hypothetical protein